MVDAVPLHFSDGLSPFIDRVTSMITSSNNNPIDPVPRRVHAKVIASSFAVATQILRASDEEWFEDGTPLRRVLRLTLYPHFNYVTERNPSINPFKLQKALVPWFLSLATSLVALKICASFGAFDDATTLSPEELFKHELKRYMREYRRFFPGICATFTGGSLTGVLAAAGADKVNAHLFGSSKDTDGPEHRLPFDCESFLKVLADTFLPEERTPLTRTAAAVAPNATPIAPPQTDGHHSSTRRQRSRDTGSHQKPQNSSARKSNIPQAYRQAAKNMFVRGVDYSHNTANPVDRLATYLFQQHPTNANHCVRPRNGPVADWMNRCEEHARNRNNAGRNNGGLLPHP